MYNYVETFRLFSPNKDRQEIEDSWSTRAVEAIGNNQQNFQQLKQQHSQLFPLSSVNGMDVHRSKNGAAGLNGLRIARVCMRETCDNRRRRRRRRSVGISLFRSVEKRRCRARARRSRSLPRVGEKRRGHLRKEKSMPKKAPRRRDRMSRSQWFSARVAAPLSDPRRDSRSRSGMNPGESPDSILDQPHSASSSPSSIFIFPDIHKRDAQKFYLPSRQLSKISLYRYVLIIIWQEIKIRKKGMENTIEFY